MLQSSTHVLAPGIAYSLPLGKRIAQQASSSPSWTGQHLHLRISVTPCRFRAMVENGQAPANSTCQAPPIPVVVREILQLVTNAQLAVDLHVACDILKYLNRLVWACKPASDPRLSKTFQVGLPQNVAGFRTNTTGLLSCRLCCPLRLAEGSVPTKLLRNEKLGTVGVRCKDIEHTGFCVGAIAVISP